MYYEVGSETTLLSRIIDQPVKITITDNREFLGYLKCIDHQCNMVIKHVIETRIDPITFEQCHRCIPMIMVPGHHLKKFQVDSNLALALGEYT
ncbi:hypothetical protein HMI55_000372 [Coelomomyces lativittatus]|nr:hypothetical protein HMI55_000372 [Coelomomyces lativittatus]